MQVHGCEGPRGLFVLAEEKGGRFPLRIREQASPAPPLIRINASANQSGLPADTYA